jgi:hypothetical protein
MLKKIMILSNIFAKFHILDRTASIYRRQTAGSRGRQGPVTSPGWLSLYSVLQGMSRIILAEPDTELYQVYLKF